LVRVFKKRVKVVEFTTDAASFIKNLLYPAEVLDPVKISERPDGKTVAIVTVNPRDKGVAIGKDGKNINLVRMLAKRHFNIEYITIQ
ncbi:MAG: NusA-like transcription termination signal-binding factor, partial [Candidatus Caldarchaeum sp.]|nr:NusA-like transcription termination signal-binding factor [Candidatus Caldarchaeum sp.]MDW8359953.1 NusA-like transcription termination signal-binding factor [Candidatus Caldarchaeum sp.]